MLKQLSVQNFALIDELSISFDKGLTVITGETGAGKSILMGALRLILGDRADHSSLKDKDRKCIVEGVFSLEYLSLKDFFEKEELDYWEETILRREISSQGKSRNFINDTPTTLDVMKRLGGKLIDLHSQHQSLQINDPSFQLDVLDALAGNLTRLKRFKEVFFLYQKKSRELNQMRRDWESAKKEEDFLQFQFDEIQALNYSEGECEALEQEQEILANSEEILQNFNQIELLFKEGETNVIDNLKRIKNLLQKTSSFISEISSLSERFNSATLELEDIANEIEGMSSEFDFDPNRQQWVEERMSEIYRLQKKHGLEHADGLVSLLSELDRQLSEIGDYDLNIDSLEKELSQLRKEVITQGGELSDARLDVVSRIKSQVESTLQRLGIPYANLEIDHSKIEEPNETGLDSFDFLFSANKGVAAQKLANTASGGEISRLVLSIKALIAAHKQLPTILFDEIDTGVSGEVADQMGGVLSDIASQRQVISITHLPQIAAKGETHYFVYKEDKDERSKTMIRKLDQNERVEELAKMLSGKKTTEAAINNAKDLLAQ